MPGEFVISNPAGVLKTGENTLAIQVHNINATSSDLSAITFLSVVTNEKPANPRVVEFLKFGTSEFHTNFKLDADGESLYLTNPSGLLADSVSIGALLINYSFGLHVLSVNRPAPEHGVLIGGSSFAVDPLGQILAETTDPVAVVQVHSETVGKAKLAYPGYLPVRADLYARAWDDIARDRSAKQVAAVR
jgi:hypothetical protein